MHVRGEKGLRPDRPGLFTYLLHEESAEAVAEENNRDVLYHLLSGQILVCALPGALARKESRVLRDLRTCSRSKMDLEYNSRLSPDQPSTNANSSIRQFG